MAIFQEPLPALLNGAHPTFAIQRREIEVVDKEGALPYRMIDVIGIILTEGEVLEAVVHDRLLDAKTLREFCVLELRKASHVPQARANQALAMADLSRRGALACANLMVLPDELIKPPDLLAIMELEKGGREAGEAVFALESLRSVGKALETHDSVFVPEVLPGPLGLMITAFEARAEGRNKGGLAL